VRCAMLLLVLLLLLLRRRRARVGGEERVGHPPNDWRTHTTRETNCNGERSASLRLPRRVPPASVRSGSRLAGQRWAREEKAEQRRRHSGPTPLRGGHRTRTMDVHSSEHRPRAPSLPPCVCVWPTRWQPRLPSLSCCPLSLSGPPCHGTTADEGNTTSMSKGA
jgi:hypothetical protein